MVFEAIKPTRCSEVGILGHIVIKETSDQNAYCLTVGKTITSFSNNEKYQFRLLLGETTLSQGNQSENSLFSGFLSFQGHLPHYPIPRVFKVLGVFMVD